LGNREIDFLYSGVADCTGWVIACSEGGEGEGVGDSVKEIDDTPRAYTYALKGGCQRKCRMDIRKKEKNKCGAY
jgi:hypothetical protein